MPPLAGCPMGDSNHPFGYNRASSRGAAMTLKLQNVLAQLKDGLADIYGERLRGVYLYGSHARGTPDPESDVDVLIVLDEVASYGAEIRRTSELVSSLSLANDVSISRAFASQDRWIHDQSMFFANAREDAIPA